MTDYSQTSEYHSYEIQVSCLVGYLIDTR